MRRFLAGMLAVVLLCAPLAALADAMSAMFDALDALGGTDAAFAVVGELLCATAKKDGEVYGFAFDNATGERVTWDRLFSDGDAAAAALEKIAANLSVKVSEEKAQWPYRGMTDISCLDIARG